MKQHYKIYMRAIDAGHGNQQAIVDESGKIIEQGLFPNGNHSYTGNGNPEFVGETIRQVNASTSKKFNRRRMTDNQYRNWLEGWSGGEQ